MVSTDRAAGPGGKPTDVVFLLAYSESARDHVCVVHELQNRGLTCEVGLICPNPATEAVIAEAGLAPFFWSGGDGGYVPQEGGGSDGGAGAVHVSGAIKNAARSALGASGLLEGVREMRLHLRDRRDSRRFFRPGRCRALVLECDSEPSSLYFAKAAREAGIPSIVIQSHLLPDEGAVLLAARDTPWPNWRPKNRPLAEKLAGKAVAGIWPRYVRRVNGVKVLPRTPYRVLSAAVFAGLPDSMWFQFGGPADWYAVNGPQAVEVLKREGIPEKKLVPCGQPRVDGIIRDLNDRASADRSREKLGLSPDAWIATVATQPWQLNGVLTEEEKVGEVRTLCEQLVACGRDVRVLLKPHPKETAEEYEPARLNDRVMILPPGSDILSAIRVCGVFLTQRSTSGFYAAAAGRPILTYNLHGLPLMDSFAELGLGLPVRQPEDVAKHMHRLREERGGTFLNPDRRRVLERYVRLDGGATAAVADLIERAIKEGVRKDS